MQTQPLDLRPLAAELSVTGQLRAEDLPALAERGVRTLICNRPDGESVDQPGFAEIARAAQAAGIEAHYQPVEFGRITDAEARAFGALLDASARPAVAYCRSGRRSVALWAMARAQQLPLPAILAAARRAGHDMGGVARRIAAGGRTPTDVADATHEVVVVGGGAAGIAVASSLLARRPGLDIALIDPADAHYYQPGWTLVGAGVFAPRHTARTMGAVMPHGVHWIKAAVAAFEPEANALILDGCRVVKYRQLVVCPGLKLDWDAIEGLPETLGRNGVTSNYRYDLAPYTWRLVQALRGGRALFTQPPMPIKCAGAPQKAMYLSADWWRRQGRLGGIDITFASAGTALFGVAAYVPALMRYVERYGVDLQFAQTLVRVDGEARKAWFRRADAAPGAPLVEREFDLLHVVPPQTAPDFVRASPLADAAGWVDVDPATLRHCRHDNVFALGDAGSMPNAKTAAAARKQAPVVAANLVAALDGRAPVARYDGYGSCPLTVERGKIVLAEFGYGGKLLPSFPSWLIDGTRPSRLAWLLKERILPPVYWEAMLKGREWLARPEPLEATEPTA